MMWSLSLPVRLCYSYDLTLLDLLILVWAARTFSRQLLQHLAAVGFCVVQSPFPILIYGIDEDAFFIIVLAGLYHQL